MDLGHRITLLCLILLSLDFLLTFSLGITALLRRFLQRLTLRFAIRVIARRRAIIITIGKLHIGLTLFRDLFLRDWLIPYRVHA